jgi:cytochrome P450
MDPPSQGRIRRLVAHAFPSARVAFLRKRIAGIVDTILDSVESKGNMDVIADIGDPLPSMINAEVLGVPYRMPRGYSQWARDFDLR